MSRGTVVAAMSGGVDSAVTAALLKEQGYEVIGITLQIWQEHSDQGKHGGCCSLGAVEDARRAANAIGIPHYVLNFREYFSENVIDKFVSEYARGRTPNPCVECNRTVKFDELLRQASRLGADYLATGHYARIRFNETTARHELWKANDSHKDQSYALYTLTQRQLSQTLMPLGEISSKDEVRRLAGNWGLAVAGKPDSQEICFVSRSGYKEFLAVKSPDSVRSGKVVDTAGAVRGEHSGISGYTVGQRKRLPSTGDGALYVISLDAVTNTVVVGSDAELFQSALLARNLNWIAISGIDREIPVQARIRYNGTAAEAVVSPYDNEGVACRFEVPQRAITPGQAVVFYSNDVVMGGGTIEGVLPA